MLHLRALLATARIANVPSVVSNVVFGAVVMRMFDDQPLFDTCFSALAACLLYIAGNFLNDWHDVAWDRQHRPERAIPAGLFPRSSYLITAVVLFLASLGIGFSINPWVGSALLIIALLIILYTLIHKTHSWGIWVMGSCRAMLYVVGAVSMNVDFSKLQHSFSLIRDSSTLLVFGTLFVFPPIGMLCYIAGISLLAKAETLAEEYHHSLLLPRMLVFFPVLTHGSVVYYVSMGTDLNPIAHLAFHALCVFGGWTCYAAMTKISIGQRVARLLMGIPLMDGIWLSSLFTVGLFSEDMERWARFPVLLCITPLIAFALAALLQKIAPAS